jgi:hypothetical protein
MKMVSAEEVPGLNELQEELRRCIVDAVSSGMPLDAAVMILAQVSGKMAGRLASIHCDTSDKVHEATMENFELGYNATLGQLPPSRA